MRVLREVGIVRHRVGLLPVVEVVTAGVGELGGDGRDDTGGGSLLDRLVREDSGSLGRVERRLLFRREVPLQTRRDTAGIDRVGEILLSAASRILLPAFFGPKHKDFTTNDLHISDTSRTGYAIVTRSTCCPICGLRTRQIAP